MGMKRKCAVSNSILLSTLFFLISAFLPSIASAQWTTTTFTGSLGNVEVTYADDSGTTTGYYDSSCNLVTGVSIPTKRIQYGINNTSSSYISEFQVNFDPALIVSFVLEPTSYQLSGTVPTGGVPSGKILAGQGTVNCGASSWDITWGAGFVRWTWVGTGPGLPPGAFAGGGSYPPSFAIKFSPEYDVGTASASVSDDTLTSNGVVPSIGCTDTDNDGVCDTDDTCTDSDLDGFGVASLDISECPGYSSRVLQGPIEDALESMDRVTWPGNGSTDLYQEWSLGSCSFGSGWFYPSSYGWSNADVYVYPGLSDLSTISDAALFSYGTAVGDAQTAFEGDTVFFRGVNGHYGAWTIYDIFPGPTVCDNGDPQFCASCYLDGRWYFVQTAGTNGLGDFSTVTREADCNDSANNIFPGAPELCDGADNDCDAATSDGRDEPWLRQSCDGPDADYCYEGFLQCSSGVQTCSDISGDSVEICNNVDDDCDGLTDEDFDIDADGVTTCGPDGVPGNSDDDCFDANPASYPEADDTYPGAPEVCDGVDNDCDG
ncbi:putative metal-binding motif-containing protein, partial [bacterium]|nr:putative metal-binding motif-containing protein [bacterium]